MKKLGLILAVSCIASFSYAQTAGTNPVTSVVKIPKILQTATGATAVIIPSGSTVTVTGTTALPAKTIITQPATIQIIPAVSPPPPISAKQ